jgi:hypothetical protein
MPDVRCRFKEPLFDWQDFDPAFLEECPRMSYKTLAAMALPDGTRYSFAYDLPDGEKSWGALTEVKTPDGAIHRFTYGDADSFFQWPASLPVQGGGFIGRDMIALRETAYTFFSNELNKRGLKTTTIFPLIRVRRRSSSTATGWRGKRPLNTTVTVLPTAEPTGPSETP